MKQILFKYFAVMAIALTISIQALAQEPGTAQIYKGYKWYMPHDNMPHRNYPFLVIDSVRADGSKVSYITTQNWTHEAERFCAHDEDIYGYAGKIEGEMITGYTDDYRTYYHPNDYTPGYHTARVYRTKLPFGLDHANFTFTKTGVSDVGNVHSYLLDEWWGTDEPMPGKSKSYSGWGLNDNFNPENPKDGWYSTDCEYDTSLLLYCGDDIHDYFRHLSVTGMFYDSFFCKDGEIIDFLEDVPSMSDIDLRVEDTMIDSPHGEGMVPAKIFTYDIQMKWRGVNYYHAVIDTVYQYRPSDSAPAASRISSASVPPVIPRERTMRAYPVEEGRSLNLPVSAITIKEE